MLLRSILSAVTLLTLPVSAMAQSATPYGLLGDNEQRARIGVTIPFGAGGTEAESTPRLEFGFDNRRVADQEFRLANYSSNTEFRTNKVGFSLSSKPQLLFNGRELPKQNSQYNLSTGAKIGIGVGVVLAGVLIFSAVRFDQINDESD